MDYADNYADIELAYEEHALSVMDVDVVVKVAPWAVDPSPGDFTFEGITYEKVGSHSSAQGSYVYLRKKIA